MKKVIKMLKFIKIIKNIVIIKIINIMIKIKNIYWNKFINWFGKNVNTFYFNNYR